MIVRWPGQVKAGTTCEWPVVSMDFFPTFLEVAGLKPGKAPIDGESILPLLKQKAPHTPGGGMKRSEIFFHFPNYAWHMGNRLGGAVVTRNGMKLIRNYDDNSLELYDVVGDIAETKNRAKGQTTIGKAPERQALGMAEGDQSAHAASGKELNRQVVKALGKLKRGEVGG